jgi:hypothetical protein
MEYTPDLLALLLGIIAILSFTTGIYKWKSSQIHSDAVRRTTTVNDTEENHKDINQLKVLVIALQVSIGDLCDRISRMEGAFNQHNKEKSH